MAAPIEERLWGRVERSAGCWLWTGSKCSDGYGTIRLRGRTTGTHRVAYELTYGPIPSGQAVLHVCDVPACVRPDHLRLGTQQENIADMIAKGRLNVRGIRGERHHSAKLTADLVRRIRALHGRGQSAAQLGRLFGVRKTSVLKIVHRRSWKEVV